ncbi:MAG: carbohydrate ABC transporter permease [Nitriliruptor sp.]|nr:MAG: carbohydrate ABC transporter permease [Nitriliruptor sp.]
MSELAVRPPTPATGRRPVQPPSPPRRSRRRDVGIWLRTALVGLGALVMLFPFLWMVATSLTADANLFVTPPQLIPDPIVTDSYRRLLGELPLGRWMVNSVLVAVVSTGLQVFTSAMAAYAFTRFVFRGRDLLFTLYIATMMVPIQVLLVPLFIEMRMLGLVDSYPALILPLIASPFGVFLLRQALLTLPRELEEAAFVDGANHWMVFTRIVLPNAKPALATFAVFAFMASWNSFLWPLVIVSSESMMTLPLGLASLHGRYSTAWNLVMAGSTLSLLPIVAVYLVAQRYVVQGVAQSGLKG